MSAHRDRTATLNCQRSTQLASIRISPMRHSGNPAQPSKDTKGHGMEIEDAADDAPRPVWHEEDHYPPIDLNACAVPFDPRAGCAISIERTFTGQKTLIGLTFVTEIGQDLPHDITVDQAETLVLTMAEVVRQARAEI